MGSFLAVFLAAALAAGLLTPLAMAIGRKVGAVDATQTPPLPRVGGWALSGGMLVGLTLVAVLFEPTGLTLAARLPGLAPVALGAAVLLLLGTVDDIHPLPAWVKFLVQIAAASGAYALGARIELVSLPFVGSAALVPLVGFVATVVWLVGIANAFNLLDGADGVAAGSAFFASVAVFLMSVTLGHPAIGLVAAGLAGGILGFLPYNFPPARAYLGDAGSLVIGWLLAGLAVEGSTKGPTLAAIAVPLIAFGVPVFDTTITLIRRLVRGRPVFEADRDHVHHQMHRAGLTPRQVAGVIYAASAAFAVAAMVFINEDVRSYGVALLIIGIAVWMVARHLRLHELNELARLARRGLLEPRSISVNVELRRAVDRLVRAVTLDDLKAALAILFAHAEFDEVLLMVNPEGERRGTPRRWRLAGGQFVEEWPERRSDEWEVVCPFDGQGWSGQLHLRRRLGRRSLLLDLNLLIDVLQPALIEAARRIRWAEIAVR